ncbi:MAG: ATP synthase F1 subunit delta [Anaerovoracaceae bacterium]
MAELTIDITYGNALYQAAKDVDKIDIILKESKEVLEVFNQEPDLLAFINTPTIANDDKKRVIETIFEGEVCEEMLNLLCVLIDKGRTRRYRGIIKEFEKLVNRKEGVAYGEIYSVTKLSDEKLAEFDAKVSKLLSKNVKLKNEIDTSLIGGVKIHIEGKILDASLKGRLKNLGDSIMKEGGAR